MPGDKPLLMEYQGNPFPSKGPGAWRGLSEMPFQKTEEDGQGPSSPVCREIYLIFPYSFTVVLARVGMAVMSSETEIFPSNMSFTRAL